MTNVSNLDYQRSRQAAKRAHQLQHMLGVLISAWQNNHELDTFDIQDVLVESGAIESVPGGFDPAKHEDPENICEPGDEFCVITNAHTTLAADVANADLAIQHALQFIDGLGELNASPQPLRERAHACADPIRALTAPPHADLDTGDSTGGD